MTFAIHCLLNGVARCGNPMRRNWTVDLSQVTCETCKRLMKGGGEMSKLAHSHPEHDILVECARCESVVYQDEVNVEAFETFDETLCPSCAEEAFEENGPFGVGA